MNHPSESRTLRTRLSRADRGSQLLDVAEKLSTARDPRKAAVLWEATAELVGPDFVSTSSPAGGGL